LTFYSLGGKVILDRLNKLGWGTKPYLCYVNINAESWKKLKKGLEKCKKADSILYVMNDITADNNNNVTINLNTKSKAGRPAKAVSLILNKSFTLKDLQNKNPEVKSITLRAHILRGLKNGSLTKLPRVVETGKKGKPAHIFINTKVYKANLANLNKTKVKTEVTAEVEAVA